MRIKEVCKLTGLTDKAIRVYINNGLIEPEYSENYSGRKNYSFNDNDIELLKKISVLRCFDFSLNEIKTLLNSDDVESVLENHIDEIKSISYQSTSILNSLLDASIKNCKSTDELCLALEESKETFERKKEVTNDFDIKKFAKTYVNKAKTKAPKLILLSLLAVLIGILIMGAIIFACVMLFMNL